MDILYIAHFNVSSHRWFKSFNVAIASENKQRVLAKSIVGNDLIAEKGAFTISVDKGEEIKEVPFAYHPNFIAKVTDIINQHERQVCVKVELPIVDWYIYAYVGLQGA